MSKPKCILTVDVEAWDRRAPDRYVDTLIYGRLNGGEWGIGRIMDIADKHHVKMTFFLDFAEVEFYGDEIIEAGRYIASRGHDLQIHCHHEFLADKVLERFPHVDRSYASWHGYEDEAISDFIVDYCLEQYRKCCEKSTVVFRGGGYRTGKAMLKKLKEKGLSADASYNFLRPRERPDNQQFFFENGLLELPLGILPEQADTHEQALNFNSPYLYPIHKNDWRGILEKYESIFQGYYHRYGEDAIPSLILHSWSFCHERERFQETGYIDRPNPYAPELFDRFLERFASELEFITAEEAARSVQPLKSVDFDAIFSAYGPMSPDNLRRVERFIQKNVRGRNVVIWGRGWMESVIIQTLNLKESLNAAFYVSQDAHAVQEWRGIPVKTFEEAGLTPECHYVLVIARASFQDIRESLKTAGFLEYEDFYDIKKFAPGDADVQTQAREGPSCPICGGSQYEVYNGARPRRCVACGSVERHRTIPKLFAENIGVEWLSRRILHISPGIAERKYFQGMGAENITTIDIRPRVKANLTADICHMPQIESDSFDMVFANCVLNHVYDDEAALSEISRVLRPKGLFVVWVTPSGNRMKTTVPSDTTAWYGKEEMEKYRVGTYRYYGETDFAAQLKRHFESVRCFEKYDEVTETSCCWFVCGKE